MPNHNNSDKPKPQDSKLAFDKALLELGHEHYTFKLYIAGMSRNSQQAINNIQLICETHLQGRYNLEIIDIYQQATIAKQKQIIAAPTLVKELPLPARKFIGDLSHTKQLLAELKIISNPFQSKE
jgi:circadian clock protein KaiB